MRPDFGNALAKLRRGNQHFQSLRRLVGAWEDSESHRFVFEPDPDARVPGQTWRERVEFLKQPDLQQWSLILGDMIHCYRSALDHTVYALAVATSGNDPPPAERTLQFPICDTGDAWKKAKWRIETLPRSVRAEIQRLQPYIGQQRGYLWGGLKLLRDLDDADKHRLLQVVLQMPRYAKGHFHRFEPGGTVFSIISGDVLYHNAVFLKHYFSQPQEHVNMTLETNVGVFFSMIEDGERRYSGVTKLASVARSAGRRATGELMRFV